MLLHIVAAAENRVIGKDNQLPWNFSADLKYFKELTTGQTVIMGRKTYESIGRPLPNRENFILSRNLKEAPSGTKLFGGLDEALSAVTTEKAFIIGGADLYLQTIERVDGIYLTQIPGEYEGDAFYPEIPTIFKENSRRRLQEEPAVDAVFYRKSA